MFLTIIISLIYYRYPAALHIGDVRIRADAGVKCNTPPLPLPTEERSRQEQKQSSGRLYGHSPHISKTKENHLKSV